MNPVLKRTLTGMAVGLIVLFGVLFAPVWLTSSIIAVLAVLSLYEYAMLLRIKAPSSPAWKIALLFVAGAAVIACGLGELARIAPAHGNLVLLYVIMIVKFSDVGGFAFGIYSSKHMKGGNHKMCPSISPGKSWEGMAGSIFASCLVSCCWMGATHFTFGKSIALGATAAAVGTFGDLVESKFKRWVGVKDSSTMKITNGMGGFLDMLDSLLFAPAVIMAMI